MIVKKKTKQDHMIPYAIRIHPQTIKELKKMNVNIAATVRQFLDHIASRK